MARFIDELKRTHRCGDLRATDEGTEVVLFGPGDGGEPTAQDWAEAVDTISYEIVTRVGGRFVRRHVDTDVPAGASGRTAR